MSGSLLPKLLNCAELLGLESVSPDGFNGAGGESTFIYS